MELIMESVLCLGAGYVIWANTKLKREKFAQWSELPDDVLCFILRKLNLADYVRCSAVCVSWRRLVAQKPYPPTNELPWLMLSHRVEGITRIFLSLSEGRVYRIKLPEFRGTKCCGSSEGWLVMVTIKSNGFIRNFLLNPFSRAQIQLPSQITTPYGDQPFCFHQCLIKKAILSSAPTPDNIAARNCIVVASIDFGASRNLAYCRPGDEKWSVIQVEQEENYILYLDIIFYNRKVYALDHRDKLTVCEFDPDPKTIRVDIPSAIYLNSRAITNYLVESSGELLWIVKNCPSHVDRDGVAAKGFRFYKFDASTIRWMEVKRLDDCALFLGKSHSMSLVASQYQGIYLTGSRDGYVHAYCKHWHHDSALFSLDDGDSYYETQSVWITPNPWSWDQKQIKETMVKDNFFYHLCVVSGLYLFWVSV